MFPSKSALILLTHIPKTSGTSFRRLLVESNILEHQIIGYRGLKDYVMQDQFTKDFIFGHFPYGLHTVTVNRKVQYLTFLREPVDRAISYYHFIKDVPPEKLHLYKHPFRDFADSVTLPEFFENQRFNNIQTRYISGFLFDRACRYWSTARFEELMLKRAMFNLEFRYASFGLLEFFNDSLTLIAHEMQWLNPPAQDTLEPYDRRQTGKRPRLSEVDDRTVSRLRKSNHLDVELYQFACHLFQKRLSQLSEFGLSTGVK